MTEKYADGYARFCLAWSTVVAGGLLGTVVGIALRVPDPARTALAVAGGGYGAWRALTTAVEERPDGLVVRGPLRTHVIPWADVAGFDEQVQMFVMRGWMWFRRLPVCPVVVLRSGRRVTLYAMPLAWRGVILRERGRNAEYTAAVERWREHALVAG